MLLDPLAAQVLDGLPARGAVTEDDLAVRSGVAVRDVMVVLPLLRLAGWWRPDPTATASSGQVGDPGWWVIRAGG